MSFSEGRRRLGRDPARWPGEASRTRKALFSGFNIHILPSLVVMDAG